MTRVVYVVEVNDKPVDASTKHERAVYIRDNWCPSGKVVRYVPAAKLRKFAEVKT